MTGAQLKRQTAIGMLIELYLPTDQDHEFQGIAVGQVGSMGRNIRVLSQLGKTDRWQQTIERWAKMADSTGDSRWALLQGAVYANSASQ